MPKAKVEQKLTTLLTVYYYCTFSEPNWSILVGSWRGQIEKKFQSRIHRGQFRFWRGQFRFWRGQNGTCPNRFGSNSPKRTLMGKISPQQIGANLAFGVFGSFHFTV